METLHGVAGGGAEDAAPDVPRLAIHGPLLRRHGTDVIAVTVVFSFLFDKHYLITK